MSKVRIGINGLGRIGRCAFRIASAREDVEVVGINDLGKPEDLAYLLKYDSVHGRFGQSVKGGGSSITVGDREIPCASTKNPEEIPWAKWGADIVIESTGVFTKREQAARHLTAGAKRVIISAPSSDSDGMFVLGVNADKFDPSKHQVVSMASCTTNCLAPVAKVLHESFGVEHMLITTVHAYTASQAILDGPSSKGRNGRAAALSIIPASTGAAKAASVVLPELKGRIDGMALRVPVPDGSVTDIFANLSKSVTVESVNNALREAAGREPLRGILEVSDEELVSSDIVGNPHSSIVDSLSTMVIGDRTAKVLSWYDNEWGYSTRLIDFAKFIATR